MNKKKTYKIIIKTLLLIFAFTFITATTCISPDASQSAKIVFQRDFDNVYVMNADGSGQKQLTDDGESTFPAFSPDRSKIVFRRDSGSGDYDIWIMNIDGSGQKQLTGGNFPSFSPTGNKIVFVRHDGSDNEIFLMNVDGSNQTRLTNNGDEDRFPVFSGKPR